jgi:hypothetical protein
LTPLLSVTQQQVTHVSACVDIWCSACQLRTIARVRIKSHLYVRSTVSPQSSRIHLVSLLVFLPPTSFEFRLEFVGGGCSSLCVTGCGIQYICGETVGRAPVRFRLCTGNVFCIPNHYLRIGNCWCWCVCDVLNAHRPSHCRGRPWFGSSHFAASGRLVAFFTSCSFVLQ